MIENIQSKEDALLALETVVLELIQWVSEQEEDRFHYAVDEKWSTAQQLEHLRKSSAILTRVINKPKFIISLLFGKPNRPSRSYVDLIERYKEKLSKITPGTNRFSPKNDLQQVDKKQLVDDYLNVTERLIKLMKRWREKDLDHYILPHPLLGKLTIREMMFFMAYHTEHHMKSIQQLYKVG